MPRNAPKMHSEQSKFLFLLKSVRSSKIKLNLARRCKDCKHKRSAATVIVYYDQTCPLGPKQLFFWCYAPWSAYRSRSRARKRQKTERG